MIPIAIVGRACVLPGAHDPVRFARNVLGGADLVQDAPEGRWGGPNALFVGDGPDRSWTAKGGYVDGWRFDPAGYRLPADQLSSLDPLVHWLLACGREALGNTRAARTGAVFGNLSFPTEAMARYGEAVALGRPPGDARNHYMSGLPAGIVASALGLDAGAFCLDAACASSIFALKLACDALASGRVDRMLAGAVQRADNLFLHVGFCRLGAMSKTGRSRPFHTGADGLLPAEGCVVFALKRLNDAVKDGDRIHGVLRGIGLSNDGRARGLLAPSSEGQVRAMRIALSSSGLSPEDIQLFECHATGTPTGDVTEIGSLREVYSQGAIGSLKSNLGHLITTAGAAGLLKVLAAMEAETMPPTLHADDPIDLGPFSLLTHARPWHAAVRRAAVSAFGFGGNNGHLLVESYVAGAPVAVPVSRPLLPVAVVGQARWTPGSPIEVALDGLRFPPSDLRASLAQQALALQLGREAFADAGVSAARDRIGVYVGMGCDGAITRWGLRWRLPALRPDGEALRDQAAEPLRAEHVIGTMPNIPANRLNIQLDAAGIGFSISGEECSGHRALAVAMDALRNDELDVAVVVAVDLAGDPRAVAARTALGLPAGTDGAVALVLTRQGDAYGWLSEDEVGPLVDADRSAHAASGLLAVHAALAAPARARIRSVGIDGQQSLVTVRPGPRRTSAPPPRGAVVTIAPHVPLPAFTEPSVHRMPPAPTLPGVLDEIARGPTPVVLPAPASAPASYAAPVAPSATGTEEHAASPEASAAWQLLQAHRAGVLRAHQSFLETQASLHRHFLGARGETSRMLVGMAGADVDSGDVPVLVPVPTMSAPALAPAAPVLAVAPPVPVAAPIVVPPAPAPVAATPAPEKPTPAPVTAAVVPDVVTRTRRTSYPGPHLDRAQLEAGASGPISGMFGPLFTEIDGFHRVIRMPMPPLLLADRVLGIEGPPMVLGRGTIWTETDVKPDSWWLHDGRMPPGIMIESGQADLLLGSWQGIDRYCRSERIYRLLGCRLTWRGDMPKVGETLHYEIHIDGHAKLGDIRMFFFHYDCTIDGQTRLEVREGQAGFFSDQDLLDSGGVLWDPAESTPELGPPVTALVVPERWRFERSHLQAFADGDVVGCFGPAFSRASCHTWTPRIAGDRMLFLDRVEIDPAGGPWKRGHFRGEQDIDPAIWFFEGHFHNDPCMPGTLMFEGCMQAMALYLTALGVTLDRDGWRFRPAQDIAYNLRCRGQVIPTSKLLVYELFVQEVSLGPIPRLKAQVLCTVDGLKCFHADPLVIELIPDWPLSRMADPPVDPRPVAYDYRALLACAWGRPTEAFGPMYAPFDGPRKVPRLPGPPYHFMTRIPKVDGVMGGKKAGAEVWVEYDVPPDAWYFAQNGAPVMPFAVLLEAALQPCGWLASWVGCTLGTDADFLFRNLDGKGTVHREVLPDTGTLRTHVRLVRLSQSGGMIIVGFLLQMSCDAGPVYDLDTVFGFFPPEAFAKQAGVGSTEADRAWLASPGTDRDLRAQPSPGIASGPLLMLDRTSLHGPDNFRAEKDVVSGDWFFKAHFYQDPVQPGSLGIEAMLQLMMLAMTERGMTTGMAQPRFDSVSMGHPHAWKYRGQVVPENRLIQTELRLTKIEGKTAWADAWLWVDGLRIYEMKGIVLTVRDMGARGIVLPVPTDHAPTWTVPSAPMMTMALTSMAATGATAIQDGLALRWLTFPDGPRTVTVGQKGDQVSLRAGADEVFRARRVEAAAVPRLAALTNPRPGPDGATLYAEGGLFHGPRFQAVDRVVALGDNGATVRLRGGVAPDVLLDAATHAIPHDAISRWFPELDDSRAAYPARLRHLALLGPLPADGVDVELRAVGMEGGRPVVDAVLSHAGTAVAWFRLEEVLLPKGPIGLAPPQARRAFLQGQPTPGVALSRIEGDRAVLTAADVKASDWLPGTVAAVYGSAEPTVIATKDLVAAVTGVHPRSVDVDGTTARVRGEPWHAWPIAAAGDTVQRGARQLDLAPAFAWWRAKGTPGPWPGEHIISQLADAWIDRFVLHDPDGLAALRGTPCLFLGNHETYLESPLFCVLMAALLDLPVRALAKVEHQSAWLGALHGLLTSYPGHELPGFIAWFDQSDPASLPAVLAAECRTSALLVHVEGTRQLDADACIGKISSVWADLAVERGLTIVPVAFRGGAAGEKADVPVGPQDHHVGRPIPPAELAALPYAQRRAHIAAAIDALPRRAARPDGRRGTPSEKISDVVNFAATDTFAAADAGWRARWATVFQRNG